MKIATSLNYLAAILFGFAAVANAQDTVPLTTGTKAVLFSFSGLSNLGLGQFDGGIGGKYYWTDQWALRGALQFSSASQSIPANPAPGQLGSDGSLSGTQFGISAAGEYHLSKSRVTPYLGVGARIMFASTESKNAVVGGATQTTTKNNRNGETINGTTYIGGTQFGLFVLGGVEFFVAREVSLAAEYRLGYFLLSQSDEEVTNGNTTVTTKLGSISNLGITTGGALTLAVYL